MKQTVYSLRVKGCIFLLLLFLVLCCVVFYVVETRGAQIVASKVKEHLVAETTAAMHSVSSIAIDIESLTMVLATAAETQNYAELTALMQSLFTNPNSADVIAGGGVWPEPYQGENQRYLDSLFFSKDHQQQFIQVEAYNQNPARAYFNEEWYVPAYWLKEGQSYWSQSYTDPYTHESMVTCSMPYFHDGKMAGVVTIDVRLSGLAPYLKQKGDELGGYLAMFDRSGRFIFYPQEQMVIAYTSNGREPITAEQLAERDYRYVEQALNMSFIAQEKRLSVQQKTDVVALAIAILKRANAIDFNYALLVADALHQSGQDRYRVANSLFHGKLLDDPLLEQEVFVNAVTMPGTGWMLLSSVPGSVLTSQVTNLEISLLSALVVSLFVALLVAYFFYSYYILRPLNLAGQSLRQEKGVGESSPLPVLYHDELGVLIERFNRHSETLHAMRQQALATAEAKQQFLSVMSHEIRTPMNGIIGAADLIRDSHSLQETKQYIDIIGQSAQSLMRLINDILDYSRLSAQKLELEATSFNLVELGEFVYQLLTPLARDKSESLNFRYWVDGNLPEVVIGDPTRLQQILINLVGNALKFTSHGHVFLTVSLHSHTTSLATIKLTVSDTGIGIDADKLQAIFNEYEQADHSVNRQYGGSGLGLAITQSLIDLMGGALEVVSEPGEGSTFTVILPFALPSPEASASVVIDMDYQHHVLVVDDNRVNRTIAMAKLRRLGFTVESAMDGMQALSLCATNAFDLIFMDVNLPEMSGLMVTHQLRSEEGINQHTPIIAMTGETSQAEIARCFAAGMQAHLPKPIDDERFKRLLADTFQLSVEKLDGSTE
ncbi:ATP-binding protein [Thaumasiovibrio sp. DFM-14]|uniref:ATP-binding protein n=1 Tax=Thaumasiovibrio sp. DFM-14 TaxID=3384792 RepID=UPI0039A1C883